jgi:hypothetical protein
VMMVLRRCLVQRVAVQESSEASGACRCDQVMGGYVNKVLLRASDTGRLWLTTRWPKLSPKGRDTLLYILCPSHRARTPHGLKGEGWGEGGRHAIPEQKRFEQQSPSE